MRGVLDKGSLESLLQLADVSQVSNSESESQSRIEHFKVSERGASDCPHLNPRPDDVTPSATI